MTISLRSLLLLLVAMARLTAHAQSELPDLPSIEDIERAEAAHRQRESRALQVATLAGIASGTVVVRSQQLKNRAREALTDFDRIKKLEVLNAQISLLHKERLNIQILEEAPSSLLEQLSPEELDLRERDLARSKQRLSDLEPKIASAKLDLGLADDLDDAKVSSLLNERRTAFTHKLAGLQSAEEFGESLAKIKAGHFGEVTSEMPASATRRLAVMESKAKLMRRLGMLGLGASATIAIVGTWGAYAQGDITTAREAAIESEFNAMQEALENGHGDGTVELPAPEEVLVGH